MRTLADNWREKLTEVKNAMKLSIDLYRYGDKLQERNRVNGNNWDKWFRIFKEVVKK